MVSQPYLHASYKRNTRRKKEFPHKTLIMVITDLLCLRRNASKHECKPILSYYAYESTA